jgi:hypothetical protein
MVHTLRPTRWGGFFARLMLRGIHVGLPVSQPDGSTLAHAANEELGGVP